MNHDAAAAAFYAAAAAFYAANPIVYTTLRRLARQALHKGQPKCGIRMLWEVMRWEFMLATTDPSGADFKLNDHYTSWYARQLMANEPDLAGFFEIRTRV